MTKAYPQLPEMMNLIAGRWERPSQTLPHWNHDPNTGKRLPPQLAAGAAQIERALQTANDIEQDGRWANTPPATRAALLEKAADWLADHTEAVAALDALNSGVVIRLTRQMAGILPLIFRQAADQILQPEALGSTLPGKFGAVEVLKRPWGTAVCITPWNSPAPLAAHKIANALAAGCPTILKPSEFAPYSAMLLAQAIEAAGFPPGVFQLLHGGGAVGAALVGDRRTRCVSFTGGLHGGRAVAQACAIDFKPLQLELGGNNALIVLEDADLEAAAAGIVAGLTTLNGQWCRALGRLLVHESVQAALLDRTLDRLAAVKIGHSLDERSEMGPLVHRGHWQGVQTAVAQLQSQGGVSHQPTPLPELPGCFLSPTLVTGLGGETAVDEIFGPVATVHTFQTDAAAVALANQTPFGLGGYVYSRDEARARAIARQMRTGGVKINGVGLLGLHPLAPRPAWGLSGFGEEGTAETFQFFCGTRVVGVATS